MRVMAESHLLGRTFLVDEIVSNISWVWCLLSEDHVLGSTSGVEILQSENWVKKSRAMQ
jgi:hypothetical protein